MEETLFLLLLTSDRWRQTTSGAERRAGTCVPVIPQSTGDQTTGPLTFWNKGWGHVSLKKREKSIVLLRPNRIRWFQHILHCLHSLSDAGVWIWWGRADLCWHGGNLLQLDPWPKMSVIIAGKPQNLHAVSLRDEGVPGGSSIHDSAYQNELLTRTIFWLVTAFQWIFDNQLEKVWNDICFMDVAGMCLRW